jgi:dipeptidyl aminopeptidase/acylaminoacyl peptidase
MRWLRLRALLPLALCAAGTLAHAAPEEAPAGTPDPLIEAHAELPALADLQVSPDGARIAMLRPLGGTYGLVVLDLARRTTNIALAADPTRFHLNHCRWANDTRLVCQVRSSANLPRGGTPVRMMATAMIAVDHDGANALELLDDSRARAWDRIERGSYISLLPGDREHILVPLLDPERVREVDWQTLIDADPIYPGAWRLNIYDDSRQRLVRERANVQRWFADPDGTVRLGFGVRDRAWHLVARDDDALRNLRLGALGSERDLEVLHVDRGGRGAIIAARIDSDRRGVHAITLGTEEAPDQLAITRTLYQHPRFDFDGRVQVLGGEVQALLVQDDRTRVVPLTDAWRTLLASLDRALPGQDPIPWSWSDDGNLVAVRTQPQGGIPAWYTFDRRTDRPLRIGSELPKLQALRDAAGLRTGTAAAPSSTRWVSYPARDGTDIPALLMLPHDGARNLPTVVLPHGGPIARDSEAIDFVAEFLVARGYAVLRPQFRGSFGYGAAFIAAGFGQWGLAMQDDLVDGLAWLRARGIAHPTAACMAGLSYGGYAALVSAYKTPGLVRCAASYAGVTDLPMLLRNRNLYRFDERTTEYMLLSMNRAVLEPNSPAHNAAAFGVPVLLVHADQDVNVLVEQSRTLAAALAAAGKPHRYIEQKDGDHHLGVQAHRLQWLTELDAFLGQHLRLTGDAAASPPVSAP